MPASKEVSFFIFQYFDGCVGYSLGFLGCLAVYLVEAIGSEERVARGSL